jgi:hypothetical protein
MSSLPGLNLEAFVMWDRGLIVDGDGSTNPSLQLAEAMGRETRRTLLTGKQFAMILARYEPYRLEVERRLDDFNEEEQSWRDYAGYAFDFLPESVRSDAQG